MIKSVIFDLDGTLIDAFEGHVLTWNAALRAKRFPEVSAEEIGRYYGQTGEEMLRQMMKKPKADKDVMEVLELKREFYRAAKGAYIKILPGAKEIINALFNMHIPIAIASSASRSPIETALNKMGIKGEISAIVSAENIAHSKPHPEAFIKASEALKTAPSDCLVFEDSVHGIVAAKAAGMKCAAVATGTAAKKELEALRPDYIFDSLTQALPPKLGEIIR